MFTCMYRTVAVAVALPITPGTNKTGAWTTVSLEVVVVVHHDVTQHNFYSFRIFPEKKTKMKSKTKMKRLQTFAFRVVYRLEESQKDNVFKSFL